MYRPPCSAWLLLLATALPCTAPLAQPLPPPPTALPTQMQLYLELVVNDRSSGQVAPVLLRGGHYFIDAELLHSLHVRTGEQRQGPVPVDLLPGVRVVYDNTAQRLLITVPPDWLPEQAFGEGRRMAPFVADSGQGMLLNYDLYASNLGRSGSNLSVWNELRGFGSWGSLSTTGVYQHGGGGRAGRYIRYDTRWTLADTDNIRSYSAGDLIAAPLAWGSAVRLGGVQVARNFSIRPDIVTFPLPQFSGQAAVPSAVDLFINGYKAGSERVQPGPFTLNTAPYLSGAGEASVVTTDALGRQVVTTIPFYVANTLLAEGLDEYALAAGALRRHYGQRNFAYGAPVASGGLRHGLTHALTVEGRAEVAEDLLVAGAGLVGTLRTWGVVNAALSRSQVRGAGGTQANLGYQYNAEGFGFGAQLLRRSAGYADLGSYGTPDARPVRHTSQLYGSLSLGAAGALSAGYFALTAADGSRTRVVSSTYSRPLGSTAFLSLIFNRVLGQRDYNLQAQVSWPLGGRGSATVGTTRTRERSSAQAYYTSTPPPDGGVGWNLAYASNTGGGAYQQAGLTWRTPVTQLQGGVFSQGRNTANWFGASGSAVLMDGRLMAANRVNDAFVLVSTQNVPGVGVRYENQLVGRTDARGHLLVPGIPGYYPARIEVDLLDLPDHMQIAQTQQRIAVRAGTGALLRFEITSTVAARITLHDEAGQPLPVGAPVLHMPSGQTTVVGWDGLVYLEGLVADNELRVSVPGGARCRARFAAAVDTPQVLRIGPLACLRDDGQQTTLRPYGAMERPSYALLPFAPTPGLLHHGNF